MNRYSSTAFPGKHRTATTHSQLPRRIKNQNSKFKNDPGIFECRLDEDEFTNFWLKVLEEIDEDEDPVVAYKIDARCAKETLTAGTMVCSEKCVCYLV